MARKIGIIILIVLLYLVNIWITKENLVYSQTQSASLIEQDVAKVVGFFREICRGKIDFFFEENFLVLKNNYYMEGWGNFRTNWYKYGKSIFKPRAGDLSSGIFQFTDDETKKKFCEKNFDPHYNTNPTSTLGYLERQASLYWLLEKFEIFGLRHKDSFRGRAARFF
jgi:hypothetical protein